MLSEYAWQCWLCLCDNAITTLRYFKTSPLCLVCTSTVQRNPGNKYGNNPAPKRVQYTYCKSQKQWNNLKSICTAISLVWCYCFILYNNSNYGIVNWNISKFDCSVELKQTFHYHMASHSIASHSIGPYNPSRLGKSDPGAIIPSPTCYVHHVRLIRCNLVEREPHARMCPHIALHCIELLCSLFERMMMWWNNEQFDE